MKEYEYKVVCALNKSHEVEEEILNKYAERGWRLVTATVQGNLVTFYFEKEIE